MTFFLYLSIILIFFLGSGNTFTIQTKDKFENDIKDGGTQIGGTVGKGIEEQAKIGTFLFFRLRFHEGV